MINLSALKREVGLEIQRMLIPNRFRSARNEDVDALIAICRRCFPETARWQSSYTLARKWWVSAIDSDAVETWVVEIGGAVEAFLVLIIDEAKWKLQKHARHAPIWFFLPALLRLSIWKQCWSNVINRLRGNKSNVCTFCQIEMNPDLGSRIWLELLAVKPERWGGGVAHELMVHSERRAFQLNRQAIVLRVVSRNLRAKRFYEKEGYLLYRADRQNDLYIKMICG